MRPAAPPPATVTTTPPTDKGFDFDKATKFLDRVDTLLSHPKLIPTLETVFGKLPKRKDAKSKAEDEWAFAGGAPTQRVTSESSGEAPPRAEATDMQTQPAATTQPAAATATRENVAFYQKLIENKMVKPKQVRTKVEAFLDEVRADLTKLNDDQLAERAALVLSRMTDNDLNALKLLFDFARTGELPKQG